jgi:hypothetical protein
MPTGPLRPQRYPPRLAPYDTLRLKYESRVWCDVATVVDVADDTQRAARIVLGKNTESTWFSP